MCTLVSRKGWRRLIERLVPDFAEPSVALANMVMLQSEMASGSCRSVGIAEHCSGLPGLATREGCRCPPQ